MVGQPLEQLVRINSGIANLAAPDICSISDSRDEKYSAKKRVISFWEHKRRMQSMEQAARVEAEVKAFQILGQLHDKLPCRLYHCTPFLHDVLRQWGDHCQGNAQGSRGTDRTVG